MRSKRFLKFEWGAIAGIIAAVVAITLHLLHIVDEQTILLIILAFVGLLLINVLRHAQANEFIADEVRQAARQVEKPHSEIKPADVIRFGPRRLRATHRTTR